jgi:hypothetical protein
MTDALFDMPARPVEPTERISPDRRRTIRQAQALAGRVHPLGLVVGYPIRLHPDAPSADDRKAPGPRCGDCWYLTAWKHHDRTYLKCGFADSRRSFGPGTDIRRWWPACTDHSPGDPTLSPDAARWTPAADGAR